MILFVDFSALLCAVGEWSTASHEFTVVIKRVTQIVDTGVEQKTLVLEESSTGRNVDRVGRVVENASVGIDELGLPKVYLFEGCQFFL